MHPDQCSGLLKSPVLLMLPHMRQWPRRSDLFDIRNRLYRQYTYKRHLFCHTVRLHSISSSTPLLNCSLRLLHIHLQWQTAYRIFPDFHKLPSMHPCNILLQPNGLHLKSMTCPVCKSIHIFRYSGRIHPVHRHLYCHSLRRLRSDRRYLIHQSSFRNSDKFPYIITLCFLIYE